MQKIGLKHIIFKNVFGKMMKVEIYSIVLSKIK